MMLPFILRTVTAMFLFAGAAASQQAESSIRFNLFEYEGAYRERIFNFDEAYTAKFSIPVPIPFGISVPLRNDVKLIADGKPDGGAFVKFTFALESDDGDSDNRIFLEDVQIVTATIPIPTDVEDPKKLRLQLAAKLLREKMFPRDVEGFDDAEILAIEAYQFDGYLGVQLIGRYTNPTKGPMLVCMTANLNPDQPQSYLTVSHINLTLVPANSGEALQQAMSSRVANSLIYK